MNAQSLLVFSLALHFLVAVALFFFLLFLFDKNINRDVFIPAWTGFILYIFAAGNLWFHSNVYFVDVLMQLFVILQLWIYTFIYKRDAAVSKRMLLLSGLITFLAIYTEWLGIFLALSFGIVCLVKWIKARRRNYFHAALAIAVSALLSIGTTFIQYSSINGSEQFINSALKKYELRSGHHGEDHSEAGFSIGNPASYSQLSDHYKINYSDLILLLLIALTAYLILVSINRRYLFNSIQTFILFLVFFSLVLHHLVFFNFNALHDFSSLKSSYLFILLIVFIFERFILFVKEKYWMTLLTLCLILLLTGITAFNSWRSYVVVNTPGNINHYNKNAGEFIYTNAHPDEYIFIDRMVNPETMYYAGRNCTYVPDINAALETLRKYGKEKGIFLKSDDHKIKEFIRFNSGGEMEVISLTE